MFICVSPNPAIDKRLMLPRLEAGRVQRARSSSAFAGGKSAHVAMVLRTLGAKPLWIGFTGGATGNELLTGLSRLGIDTHPCSTAQSTRSNLEIVEDNGRVTEILEPGNCPSTDEINAFKIVCETEFSHARQDGFVIFSGSLPDGLAEDFYASLIGRARHFACATLVDAAGRPLALALASQPQFVKVNREEAALLIDSSVNSVSAAAKALQQLLRLGAQSAAISLGAEGLLFCAGHGASTLFAPGLSLSVRSAVGCGDSALAGFAHAFSLKAAPEDAIRLAAACAAANCVADSPGAATAADIQNFQGRIRVETLPSDPC